MESFDANDEKLSRRGVLGCGIPLGLALAMGSSGISERAVAANSPSRGRVSAEDRLDIMELFARYSWNYDCGDAEGAASTFTPDAVIEAFGAEAARGRSAIVAFIKSLYASERGDVDWQHYNGHFIFDGNAHACTVYCYWGLLQGNAATKQYGVRSFGYYQNECVKTEGAWLIGKRSINRWNRNKLPWK